MANPLKSRNAWPVGLFSVVAFACACANGPGFRTPDGGSETGAGNAAEPATDAAPQDGSPADATLSADGSDDAELAADAAAQDGITADGADGSFEWIEQAPALTAGGGCGDFGTSVSLSSDTALVGAPFETVGSNSGQGAAYVFTRASSGWIQQGPALTVADGSANDHLGNSVSLSGDTALLGDFNKVDRRPAVTQSWNGNLGVAYVFVRSGSTWVQQGPALTVDDPVGSFGRSVSLSGDTALIGAATIAISTPSAVHGVAYVFVRNGSTWTQQGTVLSANDGATQDDRFGEAVAVSGDTALVGAAYKAVGSSAYQGAAYVFVRNGANWTQQGPRLVASDGAANDLFGASVSLLGDTAVIGAPGRPGQGAAYVFVRSGSTWTQQGPALTASDAAASDGFGSSTSVQGDRAIVGAPLKPHGSNPAQGAAYVFVRSGSSWTQEGPPLLAGDGVADAEFGQSVSIADSTALVGAPQQGPNICEGAAYVFDRELAPADAGSSDASFGADASDAGGSTDSESTDATNDGGTTPDAAPPTDAGGDRGGDPLVLSTTFIQIDGSCGTSMPMESLPQSAVAPSFSIENAGGVAVAWTATVTGATFGLDRTGSTLGPGASVTVHITPLAIPSVPSSPLIGQATVTIHADIGPGFDQTVQVDEYAIACVISGATPLSFGNVPLGSSSTIGVAPTAACHGYQGNGVSFTPRLELSSAPPSSFGRYTFFVNNYPLGEGAWDVTFSPIDAVGNPVLGTQSAYIPIGINLVANGSGFGPTCDPTYANGLFVQGTGVSDAADASAE